MFNVVSSYTVTQEEEKVWTRVRGSDAEALQK